MGYSVKSAHKAAVSLSTKFSSVFRRMRSLPIEHQNSECFYVFF
jgi:hypothetical protein